MRLITVLLCVASPTLCLADSVWPGLLGPKRDGWVESFQPPAEWPQTLTKKWSVEVGVGYGTPVVVGDRVYQHARQDDHEVVWCFDLKTGKKHWNKRYATPFKMGGGGERHGKGPKSCPIYADGRLFTISITGVLKAWDAESGSLFWTQDYRREFEKNQPYWGVSTSPIVDEDRLIVHLGNDKEGTLVALSVTNGKEFWRQGKDGTSYSSPLIVEIQGVRQVVMWNHEELVGVESKTGKALWGYPAPHRSHNQNMPTPVSHQGRIYLGGENRGIQCLEPNMKVGKWAVKKVWHQKKVALDMSTAVINNDLLYGMSHFKMGQIFCLEPKTGDIKWLSPGRIGQNVAFLSLRNHVAALRDSGEIQFVRAGTDTYQPVAKYQVAAGNTWAPPVLLEKKLLIKDLDRLTLWSFGE